MTDLAKLSHDAVTAKLKAEAVAPDYPDKGSCNLDSTFYCLGKGEKSAPVVAAFEIAGLKASATRWIGRGVMVYPPTDACADRRHQVNEVFIHVMRNAGWPVIGYYQLD